MAAIDGHDGSYKSAYEALLKENTLLHAQKREIVEAAEKSLRKAAHEIDELQRICNSFLSKALKIVEHHFGDCDSQNLHRAKDELNNILDFEGKIP